MNIENIKNHSHSRRRQKKSVLPIIIFILVIIIIALVFVVVNNMQIIKSARENREIAVSDNIVNNSSSNDSMPKNINSVKLISNYDKNVLIDEMDIVKFGSYPISDTSGNTKEDIEWIVLDRKDNKALLLSKYILDCKCYSNDFKEVTWEECDLRNWLNTVFYNKAFSDKEKDIILDTIVINNDNPEYNSKGGNNTNDKVFCLSVDEVKEYFGYNTKENDGLMLYDNAVTKGTDYAKAVDNFNEKLYVFNENDKTYEKYFGNSDYWLRTPGYFQNCATSVMYIPTLDLSNIEMGNHRRDNGVRPALWIKCE